MHGSFNRRTATRVKDGRVQRKNRHRPTTHLGYVFDYESPGRGFQHVVTKRELQAFIDIIPDWDRYAERLERITLACWDESFGGQYVFQRREETGEIFLHAWSEDLWVEMPPESFEAERHVYEQLGVAHDLKPSTEEEEATMECRFTLAQARAYMLLVVFMHELGHHHDRIHQKHWGASKGEDYAERFAMRHFKALLPEYIRVFGNPAREDQRS